MTIPALDSTVIIRKAMYGGSQTYFDWFAVVKEINKKYIVVKFKRGTTTVQIPIKLLFSNGSNLKAPTPIIYLPKEFSNSYYPSMFQP